MKEKTVIHKFLFWRYRDGTALAAYLEEMARQGWLLTGINTVLTFSKAAPQERRYAVEVFDRSSESETRPNPQAEEYIDYCGAAGWNWVCSRGKIHVFVTADPSAPPIETDPQAQMRTIVRSTQRKLLWVCLLSAIWLLYTVFSLLDTSYLEIAPLYDMGMLASGCLLIYTLVRVVAFARWKAKARRALAGGHPLPSIDRRQLIRNHRLHCGVVILSLAGIAVCFVWHILQGRASMLISIPFLLTLGIVIGMVLIVLSVIRQPHPVWGMTIAGIVTLVAAVVVSAALLIAGLFPGGTPVRIPQDALTYSPTYEESFSAANDGEYIVVSMWDDTVPLSLEDLGIPESAYVSRQTDQIVGFLAHYTHCDVQDRTGPGSLTYNIVDSRFEWMIGRYVQSILRDDGWTLVDLDSAFAAKAVYVLAQTGGEEIQMLVVYPYRAVYLQYGVPDTHKATIAAIIEKCRP
ncbi:MAG: DUF2812 domain-containing protein [Acutalibacteraceae bacterium]|jgi:hypothetical protein